MKRSWMPPTAYFFCSRSAEEVDAKGPLILIARCSRGSRPGSDAITIG